MKKKYLISIAYLYATEFKQLLGGIKRRLLIPSPILSTEFQNYLQHNKQKFPSRTCANKILMDVFPIPQWIFVNSVIANEICQIENAEIESYGDIPRPIRSNILYESFGCKKHHLVKLNKSERKKRKDLYLAAIKNIKSKKDLLDYTVDGVRVGLDIYESILQNCKVPTVNLDKIQTHQHLLLGLTYYLFSERLFSSGKYKALLVSHDNYISMGTVAQVAYRYKVPVYLANPYEITKPTHLHHLYERLSLYPRIFQRLSEKEKTAAREWSRSRLALRLSGKVGVEMSYQTKSAFGSEKIARQIKESDKPKILIAAHCFYDNPHGMGWMLFPDFYEWISFLGKLSYELNYDWYIKTHRDYLPGTMEVIEELRGNFSNLSLIDPDTSWHQLKDEGVNTVLTCYGSIGHELPLLGFNVVNAAYNPHIAYSFNAHPKTTGEYKEIIRNIKTLKIDIRESEIYEFFYVHNQLTQPDDVFFTSTEDYLERIKTSHKEDIEYDIYLSQQGKFDEKVKKYFSKLTERKTAFIYE